MKKLLQDISAPLVILCIALYLHHHAGSFPPPRFEPMGPSFFPELVLKGIILLSLFTIGKAILAFRQAGPPHEGAEKDKKTSPPSARRDAVILPSTTVVLFTVYILLIVYTDIHFLILSFLFICLLCFILNGSAKRNVPTVFLSAGGVIAVVYLVFGKLLAVFFP